MSVQVKSKIIGRRLQIVGSLGLALWMLSSTDAAAQTFDSGSDGSDGALSLTTPGTFDFFDPAFFSGLDPDGDGVYHFTTITVDAGVTLTMKSPFRGPLVWLASGDVQIDGVIDLDGAAGHSATGSLGESIPGSGGYGGGRGGDSSVPTPGRAGNGPGGGESGSFGQPGGGAGHATDGGMSQNNTLIPGGPQYGNAFLLPLIGGSGGGGGSWFGEDGGGGGAGGGALLIASSSSIGIGGVISANGGVGGSGTSTSGGGGGSGGALCFIAPALHGLGTLTATGGLGSSSGGSGAAGRIRLETFLPDFSGSTDPGAILSVPSPLFLSPGQIPVRVTRVNGVDVPLSPTGSYVLPDVVIDSAGEATLEIEAHGIPLGTIVQVTMHTEDGTRTTFNSTALTGTVELSTATAAVVIPHGLSRFFIEAMWTP